MGLKTHGRRLAAAFISAGVAMQRGSGDWASTYPRPRHKSPAPGHLPSVAIAELAQTMQTGTDHEDHADKHRPCRQAQTMQTMQTGTDHAWLPAVRVPSSCPLDPPTAWTVHMLDVRAED